MELKDLVGLHELSGLDTTTEKVKQWGDHYEDVLRLGVCLPLAQCFNLPKMLMGQIAQNRCYRQVWVN